MQAIPQREQPALFRCASVPVVDPRLLRCLHDRGLIILRNKSIRRTGAGGGWQWRSLRACILVQHASFLAPLGNVGNALRWSDDVVVLTPRQRWRFRAPPDRLSVRLDAQKVDNLSFRFIDVAVGTASVPGHDVCSVPPFVPRLRGNNALPWRGRSARARQPS